MLARKIDYFLDKWKNSNNNECLLVKGARQIGKTYAIRTFGKKYKSYIELNFIENPEYKTIFNGKLNAHEIKKKITLSINNINFIENDTLLFLDEIQECPQARTALKFLAQDDTIDVVASGSLLGISYLNPDLVSVPVGYEKQIDMYPLDFEEFLWAKGYGPEKILSLKDYYFSLKAVPSVIHENFLSCLREYMVIGGMPAVVAAYIKSDNFSHAYKIQKSLLTSYLDDIAKYAPSTTRVKARNCYESIPKQLAKENTKFQYSLVEKKGTARKFESTIDWLEEADLVLRCKCVSTVKFPLAAYEENNRFRIYLNDMGLLTAMYGFEMMKSVYENTLNGPMKGGYYENFVANTLACANIPLRYWINNSATEEIEFLTDSQGSVDLIEVKAGRGATATLNKLLKNDEVATGYKLGAVNVGKSDNKITLPLYMAIFLFPSAI